MAKCHFGKCRQKPPFYFCSIIPDGETVICPGDHAVIVTAAGRLKDLDAIVEEEQ